MDLELLTKAYRKGRADAALNIFEAAKETFDRMEEQEVSKAFVLIMLASAADMYMSNDMEAAAEKLIDLVNSIGD